MAQSQQVTPDTLPSNFGQWDSSPDTLPPNFSGFDAPKSAQNTPPEPQSSAMMRFIKAAGAKLYAGTAGAGPQQSGTITQDFSQQQAQAKAGTLPSAWQTLKNSASEASPSNIDIGKTLSSVNPIDMERFKSGDVAGGLGASAANLLMLKKAFQQGRTGKVAELNAPNNSEMVQPIGSYSTAGPQKLLPAAPIELGPSSITPQTQEGVLPAARKVFDDGKIQYLTRPLRPGESPDVYKNTNSNVQEYFIQKMRDALERQTATGTAEQDAATQRMAEYAKTPVDPAQAFKARYDAVKAAAESKANAVPGDTPQIAYRVRDAGETGIMPKGHAQATTDLEQAQSYVPGRGQAQNAAQELVKVDLSKLDPSEYSIVPGPGGKQWVKFKGPVPESYISKVGVDEPRVPTSDADMMDLLMKSIKKAGGKASSAKAGD